MVILELKSKQQAIFVKVLSDENFRSQMTIPKDDITEFNGGKFWETIWVKGPVSTRLHEIGVEFDDHSITFKQGWNQLIEKNAIQRNYILIFRYEKVNLFNLIICNNTGKKIKESRQVPKKGKNIVDQSTDNETERSESDSKEESDSDSDSEMFSSDSSDEVIPKRTRYEFRSKRNLKSNRRPVLDVEKYSAKRKAEELKLQNPNFLKEMTDHQVYMDFNLTVPVSFAREFFQKKSSTVSLKVAGKGSMTNDRIWKVGCIYTVSNNQETWRFFSGWKVFSFDNNLENGDCCVFELTKRDSGTEEVELTVHIFRVVKKIVRLG